MGVQASHTPTPKPLALSPEEERLIKLIRETGWGEISGIVVKGGKPAMVKASRDVKLT